MLKLLAVVACVLPARTALADQVTVVVSVDTDHDEPPPPPPRLVARAPLSARVTIGHGRDDGGTYAQPITGALSYAFAPHARLVASAVLVRTSGPGHAITQLPLRLGIEGRAGAAGLELGGFVSLHRDCAGAPRAGGGGYTVARVYVPVSAHHDFVLEATGFYATVQPGCHEPTMETVAHPAYGGYAGAGIEWRL